MTVANIHPVDQISRIRRESIARSIRLLAERFAISEEACREVYRVAYEAAWDDALAVPGAARFSRLRDKAGNPIF